MTLLQALLLVGPTGSGKTPLGQYLQARGLRGRRCLHLDFGERLRALAEDRWQPDAITATQRAEAAAAVASGALLEDHQFPVAAAVLSAFLAEAGATRSDLVVLNGLPRHIGQARGLEPVLDVCWAIHLDAPASVVHRRIRADAGGDRGARRDDALPAVERRLERFHARTAPLLAHYAALRVPLTHVAVGVGTRPEEAVRALPALWPRLDPGRRPTPR